MENDQFSESREEGKKVWKALQNQGGEATGFFGAMIYSIVLYFKKNLLGAVIMAVIFGAIGFGLSYLQKPSYHAEMTLSYAQLEKKIYADMIYKLDQLVENKQLDELTLLLDMPVEDIEKIKNIDSKNIHHQPLIQDISSEKVPFYIVVDVFDNSILEALEPKLVAYLSASSYVQERLKLNKANFDKEAIFLKKQISYSDNLKEKLLQISEPDADILEQLEAVNNQQYEYFKQLRDIESAMLFNENIEVLDGFVAQQPSQTKKMIKYILLGMVVGVMLRLVFPLFRK